MNKDEILIRSRNSYKDADEMDLQVRFRAASISRNAGFVICLVCAMMDILFLEGDLIWKVCFIIYYGMQSIENWICAIKLKKRWDWVSAAATTLVCVMFSVSFLIKVNKIL